MLPNRTSLAVDGDSVLCPSRDRLRCDLAQLVDSLAEDVYRLRLRLDTSHSKPKDNSDHGESKTIDNDHLTDSAPALETHQTGEVPLEDQRVERKDFMTQSDFEKAVLALRKNLRHEERARGIAGAWSPSRWYCLVLEVPLLFSLCPRLVRRQS